VLTCTLIATDQGLALARPEIEAIADAPCLKVAPVLGELTHEKVHNACDKKADVFWYAGHMDSDGIPLVDGSWLPPVVIGAYVAAFEYRIAVLNSCSGRAVAQAIHSQAPRCLVIYHESTVDDADAYHLGCLLSQQLCAGGIESAIRFARSAGYETLQAGMSYQFPQGPSPELIQLLYELRERVVRIEEKMVRMEEDVRTLRTQQPVNISTKQLLTVSAGVFVALLALAAIISVLSGRWYGAF
jgi:hypothetical protein